MCTVAVLQYWAVSVHHSFAWLCCCFFSSTYTFLARIFGISKVETDFKRILVQGTICGCFCFSFIASEETFFFPLGSLSAWRTVNPALESRNNHVLNQSKLLAVKIMSDFGDRTLRFQHRKL